VMRMDRHRVADLRLAGSGGTRPGAAARTEEVSR
jgi:hypothetical protein